MKLLKLSSNFTELVELLNGSQDHNGTTLGRALNVTRSAVWKGLRKLHQYGIAVDVVKGQGYVLREPLILLNQKMLQQHLPDKNISVEVFESMPSTNAYLKTFF